MVNHWNPGTPSTLIFYSFRETSSLTVDFVKQLELDKNSKNDCKCDLCSRRIDTVYRQSDFI